MSATPLTKGVKHLLTYGQGKRTTSPRKSHRGLETAIRSVISKHRPAGGVKASS